MKMSMEYPCIYFEKDGKCRKFSDNTTVSYCVMGPCPEQKSSNADRIRSMSDEQMAKELIEMIMDLCEDGVPCYDFALEWLRRPLVED